MTPVTGSRRVPLEDVLKRLGDEAADAMVYVARQPDGGDWDDGGQAELSALDNFHTRKVSGGRNEASYFPHLYAYGSCTDLPVGHSSSHGDCPHEILACVTGADREDVWGALCELTGHKPPTDEVVRREREKVKKQIVERLDGDPDSLSSSEPKPDASAPQPPFGPTDERDLGHKSLVYALGREPGPWQVDAYYLDRETGDVVWTNVDAGIDEREHPHEEGRYEEIEPLPEEERDLLTVDDLREIRDAFLASRGFKPEPTERES